MKIMFIIWVLFTSFHLGSLSNMQILVTKNPMTWDTADEICPVEFKGSGYRHLAADIIEGPYNLLTVNNYDSVWLDSKAYDLGCRGDRCSFIVIRHRRFISHDFKHLCFTENDSFVIQKHCSKSSSIVNITSPRMVERLRKDLTRFAAGEEFIVSNVNFSGYRESKCEMARKQGYEFRKMFTKCNEFHSALCEHYTIDSVMVTTIEYRENPKQYTSVFVPHPANPGGMYPMKDSSDSDTEPLGVTGIVLICLSAAVAVMSLSFCIGLFIYCRRKKMTLSRVYDTIFMRPRGRNPYTLRVPNGPTSPISEQHLLPPQADLPSAPPVRHQFIRAPAVRHQPLQQAPPMARVDSMQTLASSSSFGSSGTSSSYVDDVRYYRNFSYETQPSVAPSQAPRIEIQPSTPSASERSYCSSCRRHRRKRDFLRTSSNCTSCVSQSSLYTQVAARPAQRNLSQDTNDTNSLRSQRTSRDTNETNSKSHRSHRSGRSHSRGVVSKISRLKSQADYLNTEQIATPRSSAGSQHDVTEPNPVTRRHKLVDRLGSSSGFRLVKRMFSIDLK